MVGPLLGAIGGMEPLRGGLLSEVMAGNPEHRALAPIPSSLCFLADGIDDLLHLKLLLKMCHLNSGSN